MYCVPVRNRFPLPRPHTHTSFLLLKAGAQRFEIFVNETTNKLQITFKRIIAISIATVSSELSKKCLFGSNYHSKAGMKRKNSSFVSLGFVFKEMVVDPRICFFSACLCRATANTLQESLKCVLLKKSRFVLTKPAFSFLRFHPDLPLLGFIFSPRCHP